MRPVYEMLARVSGRRSGHMPGHKGKAPFGPVEPYALDTTELPTTDDLYAPERGILEAQRLYAQAAGAAETIFLHNGSTGGIHAMVQLYAHEGDAVILPRNAHLSAVNGCILGGLQPAWVPVTQTADGYCHVAEADVLAALGKHPEAKALLVTRPDYFGGCLPLRRIIDKAHSLGVRVLVDEAHGAHLPWLEGLPSAGELGADAWVQSVHKTLPGWTGSAVLHLKDAADRSRAMTILRREQTSSPSFLLMMSIDDARAWMEKHGSARLAAVRSAVEELRASLPSLGYADAHAGWSGTDLTFDPTRLVIDAPQGGYALAGALQHRGVDVEMADDRRVVLILTAMDSPDDIRRIGDVFKNIPTAPREWPAVGAAYPIPRQVMSLRSAAMGRTEQVPLAQAAGRVAAAVAGLYPPGVPLVCPGEEITKETIERLQAAGSQQRFGVEGDQLTCVMTSV